MGGRRRVDPTSLGDSPFVGPGRQLSAPALNTFPQVFLKFLEQPEIQDVLAKLQLRNAHPWVLRIMLWQFWPEREKYEWTSPPPDLRRLASALRKCASSLGELTALFRGETVKNRPFYEALRTIERWQQDLTSKQKKGRTPGPTPESLGLAILAEFVRRRIGRPCYREILSLLRAINPNEFPSTTTTKHLVDRISSIPKPVFDAILRHFPWNPLTP